MPEETTHAATTEATEVAAESTAATTSAATTDTTAATTLVGDAAKTDTTESTEAKPETVAPVVPEKYDLKLPADSTADPAIVERTAAIARELGLSNEAGQKALDYVLAEMATREAAREAAFADANKPGGSAWTERVKAMEDIALADPDLGGSPEKLAATVELAKRAMSKFFSPAFATALHETGLGSHPELLRGLAKIGRGMSEGTLVLSGTNDGGPTQEERLARMYPSMAKTA